MAEIRGPGEPWYKRLVKNTTTYDVIGPVLTVGVGVPGAIKFFKDGDSWIGVAVLVFVVLICLNGVTKAVVSHLQKERQKSPNDLESSLHALHAAVLVGVIDGEHDPKVRVTIHVPRPGDKLEQVLDYVGDQRQKGTAGRVFPAQCGIIGRAFRTKQACVGSRKNPDPESYIKELVDGWGYTPDDARKRNPSAMAWMAVPLESHNGEVAGVVYLDSTKSDFFADDNLQELIIRMCVGIARYVSQRYN